MHSKTLIALLGIVIGIALGEYSTYASEVAVASLGLGGSLLVLTLLEKFFSAKKDDGKKEAFASFSLSLLFSIFFLALTCGIIRTQFEEEKTRVLCPSICTIQGAVAGNPEIKDSYQVFSIAPSGEYEGSYQIQVRTALYPRFKKGEELQLTGKITAPHASMQHDDKKVFDYEMYLRVHDIGSQMMYPTIEVQGVRENSPTHFLSKVHEFFVTQINYFINQPAASLASGMLFGDSSLRSDILQSFRVSGLSHIIVLSGFNVALVIGFIFFVLRFLPLIVRVLGAALFAILFVMMVDAGSSIVRATLMAFIGLAALLVGREYIARQALVVSLILIILVQPTHALHDVSLHLSFLATAGLVYLSEVIKKYLTKITWSTLQELLATTLSAYIATLPYLMYTFGSVSLYALFANIIVLPAVPILMLLSFLTVLIGSLSTILGTVLGYCATLLGNYIILISKITESLPFSSLPGSLSLFVMILLYVILFFLVSYFRTKKKNETLLTNNQEIISDVISF